MKTISCSVVARLLCIPAILLLFSGVTRAEQSLFDYSQNAEIPNLYLNSVETSQECEDRVASELPATTANNSKASQMMVVGEDCRTNCEKYDAGSGYKWFGKAPSCTGSKMDKNTKAYKDCVDMGGEAIDWSYCGNGKPCITGNKILCKLPTTADYVAETGVDGTVTWFGKPPFCNANNGEKDCAAAGGTVANKSRCSDGSSGQKADCCTSGKMVACVIPKIVETTTSSSGATTETRTYVQWFGKPPFCNADNGEKDCGNLGGTVDKKDKCTDGTDGSKVKCCTSGKMVKCLVPSITE